MTAVRVRNECGDDALWSPTARLGPWSVRIRRPLRQHCSSAKIHVAKPTKQAAVVDPEVMERFRALVKQWRRETELSGHLSKVVMAPSYQRIMAMGPEIIPLILQELSKSSGHWFWALHNLVPDGEDPAENIGATTIKDASRAWLDWGQSKGYL